MLKSFPFFFCFHVWKGQWFNKEKCQLLNTYVALSCLCYLPNRHLFIESNDFLIDRIAKGERKIQFEDDNEDLRNRPKIMDGRHVVELSDIIQKCMALLSPCRGSLVGTQLQCQGLKDNLSRLERL